MAVLFRIGGCFDKTLIEVNAAADNQRSFFVQFDR
jgi:hypothetical protein